MVRVAIALAGWLLIAIAVAALAAAAVSRLLPLQTLVVRSGSMAPAIAVGSVAVLAPVAGSELAVGDVITFQHPTRREELVTHRIVEVEESARGRLFVTRGDANAAPDDWRVPATGRGWRFAFALPLAGYVVAALRSPLARIALFVAPVLALTTLALVGIWRPRRARVGEEAPAERAA